MSMPDPWEWIFWLCVFAVAYPYAIYPLLLIAVNRLWRRQLPLPDKAVEPTLSIICPVHNEAGAIEKKLLNLLSLDYPHDRLQILVVGDGCTDETLEIAGRFGRQGKDEIIALPRRAGKAAALNAGLARATGDVVLFTDVAIRLEAGALRALSGHFGNPVVGCVSGEDWIEEGGNEGIYGRMELVLRREEAKLHSIAGASGCLYAVRRSLCRPFPPDMAPDFFSVLDTVRAGCRALCEPAACGVMAASTSHGAEFTRKTRTFLRGITALFGSVDLMNPLRYPAFSFILISHKLLRWLAPIGLAGCLAAAVVLREEPIYRAALYLQVLLYALAVTGLMLPRVAAHSSIIRICAFFVLVNSAAVCALGLWTAGVRREVWKPTRRRG
jgi:cellulose synthase/poly-beta-1,6-N-acetylglucosamine synthase-like glycosyltransferase